MTRKREDMMDEFMPYADLIIYDGGWYHICPACGEYIEAIERKDFESFTGSEVVAHYQKEHA